MPILRKYGVWLALGLGGIVAMYVILKRHAASSSTSMTYQGVPTASVNSQAAAADGSQGIQQLNSDIGQLASVMQSIGSLQGVVGQYNPSPSPSQDQAGGSSTSNANGVTGATFSQILGTVLPSIYSGNGFAGNSTDSSQGTQDLFNSLGQFGGDNAQYQDWLAQLKGASAKGDVNQYHTLLQQGEQYGQTFGSQTVTPVSSIANDIARGDPNIGKYWIPSMNNGAGGYGNYQQYWSSQHPSQSGGGRGVLPPFRPPADVLRKRGWEYHTQLAAMYRH